MIEKFLPIGSVVSLALDNTPLMIVGYTQVEEGINHVWDYAAIYYPIGYKNNKFILFDHKQIDNIYYMGCIDKVELTFQKQFKEYLRKEERL